MKMRIALLVVLFIAINQSTLASKSFELAPGQISVGGNFQIPIEYTKNNLLSVSFQLDPEIGYFVAQGVLLSFGMITETALYRSDNSLSKSWLVIWGGHTDVRYFIHLGSEFYPYFGFGVGVKVNNLTLVTLRWSFEVPLGLLWAVNEHVGIHFAIPITVEGSVVSVFEKLRVAPAYLGLMAFF